MEPLISSKESSRGSRGCSEREREREVQSRVIIILVGTFGPQRLFLFFFTVRKSMRFLERGLVIGSRIQRKELRELADRA